MSNKTVNVVKFPSRRLRSSVEELNAAEHNFNAILAAARDISTRTLLSRFAGSIKPVEDLIRDLKIILSVIRRKMRAEKNFDSILQSSDPFQGGHISSTTEVPEYITPERYENLCPLAALLQYIAKCFNQLHVKVASPNWGAFGPLRQVLIRLQNRLQPIPKADKSIYPGIAPCIMFHKDNSGFSVVSVAPRYIDLQGLDMLGRRVRYNRINQLKERCTPEKLSSIEAMERFSGEVCTHYRPVKGRPNEAPWQTWDNPFEANRDRVKNVAGHGATFEPDGTYKAACIVDFFRFRMNKPPAAQSEEISALLTVDDRGVTGSTSCAEWELWVRKVVDPPPPKTPPSPTYKHQWQGMPKNPTWGAPPRLPAAPRRARTRDNASRADMPSVPRPLHPASLGPKPKPPGWRNGYGPPYATRENFSRPYQAGPPHMEQYTSTPYPMAMRAGGRRQGAAESQHELRKKDQAESSTCFWQFC